MSKNPSILRSKSVPCRISETQNVRSTNSDDSLKPSWHKKVDEERKRGSSSSKNSRSNNLDEFNKRTAIQEEKRYSARSPYYKGLTDSSKEINRQKSLAGSTPGKDSSLLASSTSNSSKSNLAIKVQEWSASYFVRKGKEERAFSFLNVSSGNKNIRDPSSSETKVIRTTIGEELGIHSKGVRRRTKSRISQLDQGKPLRERASEMQTNNIVLLPAAPAPAPARPVTSPIKLSLPSPPPTPLILQTSQAEEIESVLLPLPASSTQNVDDEKDTTNVKDMTVPEKQIDKRFTWADKYRPNALKDFLCNRNIALELKALAETDGSIRHFIFAGLPGVGKRTMIFALLRKIYGHDKVQARDKCKVFHLKGESVPSIKVNVKESNKHLEINLSETKGYEKHVLVQLIKERKHKSSSRSAPPNPENCKAIILGEADKLSTDALLYIKWMIERYEGCYKVFFCCSDSTKLQPIKSICKVFHLQKPSDDEIVDVLKFIAQQEGIELPHQMAVRIASNSKSNLRQAIRSFEATWHFKLYDIRGKLQNLIEHNVSAEFIFNTVFEELKSNLDDQFHKDMDILKMKYNINSNDHDQGKSDNDAVKKIVHKFMKIEEFTAKFMSWYKIIVLKKGNQNPILSKGDI
uniref:Replication factor C subunit n=1 Tax=Solanum tuberosum TaxID=4113 RepID=M0ZNJ5_SOLTU